MIEKTLSMNIWIQFMITHFILSLLLEKRGDGSFVFLYLSLFFLEIFFASRVLFAGCGGHVAEVSRWSFFGDDDLIMSVFVYDITARGARDVVITKHHRTSSEPRNEQRDAFAWKVEKKGDDEKNAEWKQTCEMITKYLDVV